MTTLLLLLVLFAFVSCLTVTTEAAVPFWNKSSSWTSFARSRQQQQYKRWLPARLRRLNTKTATKPTALASSSAKTTTTTTLESTPPAAAPLENIRLNESSSSSSNFNANNRMSTHHHNNHNNWKSLSTMVLSQLVQKYGRAILFSVQVGLGWFLLSKLVKELFNEEEDLFCHAVSDDRIKRLAERLVQAGMPMQLTDGSIHSVETVLKKITRKQAQMLERILYTPSDDDWKDIVGHDAIQESLLDIACLFKSNHTSSSWSKLIQPPSGIMLYGPPGCGKSMLVRGFASMTQIPTLLVSPSRLLDKYIGESNKAVRTLFELAHLLSPCMICIEELDGLFKERSLQEHDVTRELKTEFLSLWDNNHDGDSKIVIVGTTNRPFDVDSAVLRRMPVSYFVGLPDAQARGTLIRTLLQDIALEQHSPTCNNYAPNVIKDLVQETQHYSASDLHQLLRTAVTMGPVRDARRMNMLSNKNHKPLVLRPLSRNDLERALQQIRPTPLTPQYQQALQDFANKRTNAGGIGYNNNNDATTSSGEQQQQEQEQVFYNMGTLHAPYFENAHDAATTEKTNTNADQEEQDEFSSMEDDDDDFWTEEDYDDFSQDFEEEE